MSEDGGPILQFHGDGLGVVVPIVAKGIELLLEFVGDGRDEGSVGVWDVIIRAEECEGLYP